jgi:hypothetical protein
MDINLIQMEIKKIDEELKKLKKDSVHHTNISEKKNYEDKIYQKNVQISVIRNQIKKVNIQVKYIEEFQSKIYQFSREDWGKSKTITKRYDEMDFSYLKSKVVAGNFYYV